MSIDNVVNIDETLSDTDLLLERIGVVSDFVLGHLTRTPACKAVSSVTVETAVAVRDHEAFEADLLTEVPGDGGNVRVRQARVAEALRIAVNHGHLSECRIGKGADARVRYAEPSTPQPSFDVEADVTITVKAKHLRDNVSQANAWQLLKSFTGQTGTLTVGGKAFEVIFDGV